METKTKLLIVITALIAVLFFILGAVVGNHFANVRKTFQTDTVYVWRHDTVRLVREVPVTKVVDRLKIVRDTVEIALNDNLLADSVNFISPGDSATVEIPIVQRTYEGDNYRAVVQGYRPELVSIDIRQQTVTETIFGKQRKWWSVTVGPQLGYGFTPAGWQPYAGIGISAGFNF